MAPTTNSTIAARTPIELPPWLRVLESVGLILVILASLFLNSATCLIIARNRYLRSRPANLFVANLCVSNTVLTVFVIPFSLTSLFADRHRVYQGAACTANGFFSVASCGAIVLTLCCISIDRYIAVCRPTRYRTILTVKRALLMILCTWAQAILYASFPVMGWSTYEYHPGTLHCSPAWTDGCSLYIFLSLVGFVIPLTIMVVTYIRIFIVIRKHGRKIQTSLKLDSTNLACNEKAETKETKQEPLDTLNAQLYSLKPPVTPSSIFPEDSTAVMFTDVPRDLLDTDRPYDVTASCEIPDGEAPSQSRDLEHNNVQSFANEDDKAELEPARSTSSERTSPTRRKFLGVFGEIQGIIRFEKRQRRTLRRVPREYKVARTGLLLLVVFLVLWLPYLVVHSCTTNVNAPEGVFHAAMWLVYMNGIVNPITYAFNNSSVKVRLKQICCKMCFIFSFCTDKKM